MQYKITDNKNKSVRYVERGAGGEFSSPRYSVKKIDPKECVVELSDYCNLDCVFCSDVFLPLWREQKEKGRNIHKHKWRKYATARNRAIWSGHSHVYRKTVALFDANAMQSRSSADHVTKTIGTIAAQKNSVAFEGGEPTLSKNLFFLLRGAKHLGVKNRILVTNGTALSSMALCKKLVNAGITLFNINFPASDSALHAKLTGSALSLGLKIKGIRNLMRLGQARKIRLTVVVQKMNLGYLSETVRFVAKNFPGIFYMEFNMIKVLGKVVLSPKKMVPRIREMKRCLNEAFSLCKEKNIKFLHDGFPLCCVPGFIEESIDVHKIKNHNETHFSEKMKTRKCLRCKMSRYCTGIRKDHYALFGDEELVPFAAADVQSAQLSLKSVHAQHKNKKNK